jgi:hypothetical protein
MGTSATAAAPATNLCGACKYWHPLPLSPNQSGSIAPGECRLNPPTVIEASAPRVWPSTSNTDWCGQFSSGSPQAVTAAT